MQRPAPGLRTDPATRLAEIGEQRPEWRAWLDMLGELLPWLDDPAWTSPLVRGEAKPVSSRDPLLQGRELLVDGQRLSDLINRLMPIAATEEVAANLVAAAIRHDRAGIGDIATAAGLDVGRLETVAQLAAWPLLRSCGGLLQDQVPVSWPHGYCPICGSWPLLGEFRSLDRTRRLRCGRCACDWRIEWLRCPYCGEADHERLGSLVLEGRLQRLTIETCLNCLGYLKSVNTLRAIPPLELMLWDLETVELDIAARERGYARPEGAGFPLDLRMTDARSSASVAVKAQ